MYNACLLYLTVFARNVLSTCLLTHDLLATAWFFRADCLKLILKHPLHVFAKIEYNKQHFALQYRDLSVRTAVASEEFMAPGVKDHIRRTLQTSDSPKTVGVAR